MRKDDGKCRYETVESLERTMTDLRMSILEIGETNKKLSTVWLKINKQVKERKVDVCGVYTETCGKVVHDKLRELVTSL